MTAPAPLSGGQRPKHPPGFRARRGLNWGLLGLMYTTFYICRYNLSLANKSISDEFGFTKGQMSSILSAFFLAYACGQILNGLLADFLGGKRAMLIGAVGTISMNLLFGAASFSGVLWLFVAIRGVDGYLQSFGSPGFIKVNAAWFGQTERGTFAGIFGYMINVGRFALFQFGPALLAGFVFLGLWRIPPLHWRWLFWVPAGMASVVAVFLAIFVKDTPEQAGFHAVHAGEADHADAGTRPALGAVLQAITTNPVVWIIAAAYACTGVVRQSIDQWFPRYLQEVEHLDMAKSGIFQLTGFLVPFVASTGSFLSGLISDRCFQGRRAPVAAGIYFIEVAVILVAAQAQSVAAIVAAFVAISFTANSTHSLLGPAAAMDIGGRKMAGFASGLIDSFQYFGAGIGMKVLGWLLDKNWNYYFYFMAPFGVLGGILMGSIAHRRSLKKGEA
jgi:OPA family glycerol-3-phosphate transporter-like MFS transporter